tara:strand:- start:11646 stop:12449 length:804 start_codon:yes stop_codon:yes gene_type:complete
MKDALKFLHDLGALTAHEGHLPANLKLVPESCSLKDIEEHLPAPLRYRAHIATPSIADFVELTQERTQGARCFINDDKMTAVTVFNLGNPTSPGHADDRVTLTMRSTKEWDELQKVSGSQADQRITAEWLEDWRDYLTPVWDTDQEGRATMANAINTVRNLVIDAKKTTDHGVSNFGAEKTDLEKIEARGRDMPPPARFIFKCVPFEGLQERSIALRLSIVTGEKPRFTLRIIRPDQLRQEIVEEFRQLLVAQLGNDLPVAIGVLSR